MTEAMQSNGQDFASKMLELYKASESQEATLSWLELAAILGILPNEAGNLDSVALVNACLNIQGNEVVSSLPENQRIVAIKSAMAAVDNLLGGRGK